MLLPPHLLVLYLFVQSHARDCAAVEPFTKNELTAFASTRTVSLGGVYDILCRASVLILKSQCNGLRPCNTCTKRHLDCIYTPAHPDQASLQEPIRSPTKRRHLDTSPHIGKVEIDSIEASSRRNSTMTTWHQSPSAPATTPSKPALGDSDHSKTSSSVRHLSDRDFDSRSRISNVSGIADDADLWLPRMLQDSTGRLCKCDHFHFGMVGIPLLYSHPYSGVGMR